MRKHERFVSVKNGAAGTEVARGPATLEFRPPSRQLPANGSVFVDRTLLDRLTPAECARHKFKALSTNTCQISSGACAKASVSCTKTAFSAS